MSRLAWRNIFLPADVFFGFEQSVIDDFLEQLFEVYSTNEIDFRSLLVGLVSERVQDAQETCLRGEYKAVLDLVRVMGGSTAKASLDLAIDRCSTVINLRTCIYAQYVRSEKEPQYTKRALNFLERYCYLLMYSQFIKDEMKKLSNQILFGFKDWIRTRPELTHFLQNLTLS